MPPPDKDLHVSIIGGGIAGMTLAVGLHEAHVNFDVFEKHHCITELGLGLGIGRNARVALYKLGLKSEIDGLISPSPDSRYFAFCHGQGPQGGCFATAYDAPMGHTPVHRAEFLQAIARRVPSERVKFRKDIAEIEEVDSGPHRYKVKFCDGTEVLTDVVVGCDGLRSKVRFYIDPSRKINGDLAWGGTWAYRSVVPIDKFAATLDASQREVYRSESRMFIGKGGYVVVLPLSKERLVGVFAFRTQPGRPRVLPLNPDSMCDVRVQELVSLFSGWREEVLAILGSVSEPVGKWAIDYISPSLSSYVRGAVCLVGDAAHGGTPHFGALAGQAIEDSLFLSRLLSHKDTTKQNVAQVLRAVDQFRLPRGNSIMEKALEQRDVYNLEHPRIGDDVDLLAAHFSTAWDWIWNHDHDKEFEDAVQWLQKEKVFS
ncbi:unnamed protein product [Parajaminaea phylloscopi]